MTRYILYGALALIGGGILLSIVFALTYMREHFRTHGAHKIFGRMMTGRRTDGKRHTNASFWRASDGNVNGHPVGRVGKRHHRAGVSNLLRLLGYISAIVLVGYGLTQAIVLTIILASLAILGKLGYHSFRLIVRLRAWYIHRTYITPLASALGPRFGITGPELETNIHMEPGYTEKKTGILGRVNIPISYHADGREQDSINSLISSRLPVGADFTWNYHGKAPHILIHAAPPLPTMVKLSEYKSEIAKLGPGKYLAALDKAGDPIIAEFDGEDPHHCACYATGRGKSTAIKNIIAQIFHNEPGATATVIDPKEISLAPLKGVPGISFYDDMSELESRLPEGLTVDDYEDYAPGMWQGIKSTYELMKYRYSVLKEDPTKEFPTHLLILEECNSLAVAMRAWWGKNRPKGVQGAVPPMWADYVAPIAWRGRGANIKIVLVAQTIQERFLGNLSLRSSLGLLSLSGFKSGQWQNFVGTNPTPRPQKGRGRAIYVRGEDEIWGQNVYATDREFRDMAMTGRRITLVKPTDREVIKVNSVKLNTEVS